MEARLYNDLDRQTLSRSLDGGSITLPPLVAGTDNVLIVRFSSTVDGEARQTPRRVLGVRASIGFPDARPVSGTWKLTDGTAVSAALAHDATAAAMQAALSAMFPGLIDEVIEVDGSWLVSASDELGDLEIVENLTGPVSFLRVWSTEMPDGSWTYELRLVQGPLAYTSNVRTTLPPPPSVYVVQEGDTVDDVLIPEVQGLRLDPWFEGVYRLRRGSRVSSDLSLDDGAAEVQEAIQSLLSPVEIADGADLTVTNPTVDVAHIRFGGALAGIDEPLLTVEVVDAPGADPTIHLDLDTKALASAMRAGAIRPEFELQWLVAEETAAEDEEEEEHWLLGYRGQVTIQPALAWAGLATAPAINWIEPPDPADYKPFSRDNVFVGTRSYGRALGPGATHEIDHGLGTVMIATLEVRENTPGGALLVRGTDYHVSILDEDRVSIGIYPSYGVPEDEALAVVISVAGPEETFSAHTHTIAQVQGLEAILAAHAARIAYLESLVPSGVLAAPVADASGPVVEWLLPPVSTVFPARQAVVIPTEGIRAVTLPSDVRSGLLRAIHTADVPLSLPSPVPVAVSSGQSGKVFLNDGSAAAFLPGGRGRRSWKLPVGGHAAAYLDDQGRSAWYPVQQLSGTSSWYPVQMEVPLFELLVDAEQFRPRRRFELRFGIEVAVLRSASRGQWIFVVEYGVPAGATTPGTPGPNLATVTWNTASPAISQRIFAGPVPTVHEVGLELRRTLSGETDTITGTRTLYQSVSAAPVPAAATFAIRGRLTRWDIVDAADPTGLVAVRGLDVQVSPTEGALSGFARIL